MSLVFRPRPKRPRRLRCWHTKPGTGGPRMCLRPRVRRDPLFSGRFPMCSHFRRGAADAQVKTPVPTWCGLILAACIVLTSCSAKPDPNTLVMIIESSPTNLDPRVGLDAYSERIDTLIFDDLLTRDDHLNVQPQLAERWEIPDATTYIFHLRRGVKFHDGRPLTSRDVKWTFDSLLEGKVRSTKAAAYRLVDRIEAVDDFTVVFHLKQPFVPLLW